MRVLGGAFLAVALLAAAVATGMSTQRAAAQEPCPAPGEPLAFEVGYIDETRAGGEPLVETHPDGTLLWGSHAGTTHFFGPAAPDPETAAFIQNYQGQTYQYFSDDHGVTWQFSPRTPINADPLSGLPNSGFSDPDFAIDTAGNVFISEINLANIAFSKSADSGRTWTLQNVIGISFSDRQWMEADEEDVLWFVANTFGGGSPTAGEPVTGSLDNRLYKSTDGGITFSEGQSLGGQQSSDLRVDQSDGRLYQLHTETQDDGTVDLEMWVFPNARNEAPPDVAFERYTIAEDFDQLSSIGPEFDVDDDGNLYAIWNDAGGAAYEHGVYYSASTDRGVTWSEPQQLDDGQGSVHWTWIAAGADGGVSAVWYENVNDLPDDDPEQAGPDDGWHVMAAQSLNGLGCGTSEVPGWTVTQATEEPFHAGTICNGGTICQALAIDRRLGDYFSNDVDANGNVYIATGDTRQGGAVALPLQLRQVGGPSHFAPGTQPEAEVCGLPAVLDEVRRTGGDTRLETAVGLSAACFDGADNVVLARSDLFPDALAASGLAAELDAPVLLTSPGGLEDLVAEEITRLGASTAYLMGGEAALSAQVAEDVTDLGLAVERVGGADRYATAGLIAGEIVDQGGAVEQAIVALGDRFDDQDAWPDALAAGNLAAAARAPILLATPDALPAASSEALARILDEGAAVFVAGGTAAIGEAVESGLRDDGYTVERLAGSDRYATAVALVEEAIAQGADPQPTVLATGAVFADALVAGPVARRAGGVMLLVDPGSLATSAATGDFLRAHAEEIDTVLIAGGPATISDAVAEEVGTAIADPG